VQASSCGAALTRDWWAADRSVPRLNDTISESHVYPPSQKYSHFPFHANHLHIPPRLVPQRGGSRSSRTRGGMRWTPAHQAREHDRRAGAKACERSNGARTNDVAQRTAKSCGPDAPTLASRRRKAPLPNRALGGASFRRRWWQTSPVTKESAKETVKTIACGNAGCSGVSAVDTRVLSTFAHEAAGAAGTRRSPRPLIFLGGFVVKPRAPGVAGMRTRIQNLLFEKLNREAWRADSLAPRAGRGLG
jgi:hypothetical protein